MVKEWIFVGKTCEKMGKHHHSNLSRMLDYFLLQKYGETRRKKQQKLVVFR
jgi:hypothetical protein